MKAKTKIKTLVLGVTLATAFAAVGAYELSANQGVFQRDTITAGAASAPYSGTESEPTKITDANLSQYGLPSSYVGYYAITTAEELAWFSSYIDKGTSGDLTACAVLLEDIIYNDGTVTEIGSSTGTTHEWDPIGDWGKAWSGTFDGNGHYVSGLYAKRTWSYTGFIAYTSGATVKNLTLKNSYFEDELYLGGIVGIARDGTTITGCRVESDVRINGVNDADWVGGIAGSSKNNTISDCYVAATVSGSRLTGALVGENVGGDTYSNNYYVAGCATASGYAQNAVGINSTTGGTVADVDGQSAGLASSTAAHTCVPVTVDEMTGFKDGYTYCVVCNEVLSVAHKLSYEGVSVSLPAAGDDYTELDIIETCGNCTHTATMSIRIKAGESLVYTGSPITPYEIVYTGDWQGVEKTAADIVYLNNSAYSNVNAGTTQAYIELGITGAHFSPTEYLVFIIKKAAPTAENFKVEFPNGLNYSSENKPVTVSAQDSVVGMGTVTSKIYKNGVQVTEVKDAGEYTVKVDVAEGDNYHSISDLTVTSFTVTPYALSNGNVALSLPSEVTYNGEAQKPEVSVVVDGRTLVFDTDYTLAWSNDDGFVNALTRTVTVTGKGNYSGTGEQSFTISAKPISDSEISIDLTEIVYDGNAHEPTIVVKDGSKTLVKDTDYTLTWNKTGFVGAGTYEATITGKGNYSGTFTRTLTIEKADLVIELSSPISSVLPGNQIALIHSVNSTEGTPVWNVVGGTHISGTTVKIDDSLIIGQDKVQITVTYAATANYKGDSKTIELEVGMADLSGEIDALETDVETLKTLVADKADSVVVTQKINEIIARVDALEGVKDAYVDADATLRQDLVNAIATAKQEAIDAVQANLDQAVIDLNNTIATEDGKLDDRITQEVATLNAAIDTAKQIAQDANDTLKTELEDKIALAENTLTAAINAVQANLDQAVIDLNNTIATEDGKLDDRITQEVATLNAAIDTAKQIAQDANDTLKTELEDKIAVAENTLTAAINAVQANLDQAVIDLNNTIATEDGKLDDRITQEVATLNAAIDTAKQIAQDANDALKTELEDKIATAENTLTAAINAVQANLDQAVVDLNNTIATEDGKLNDRITEESEELSGAIELAKKVASLANDDLKTGLEKKITAASKALTSAVEAVQANLDAAVADLSKAMKAGDDAQAEDLAAAIENLNAAIDLAKELSLTNDGALEEKLMAAITAADRALAEELKALIASNATATADGVKEAKAAAKSGDVLPIILASVGIVGNIILAAILILSKKKSV